MDRFQLKRFSCGESEFYTPIKVLTMKVQPVAGATSSGSYARKGICSSIHYWATGVVPPGIWEQSWGRAQQFSSFRFTCRSQLEPCRPFGQASGLASAEPRWIQVFSGRAI